jgi:hypothetical protein
MDIENNNNNLLEKNKTIKTSLENLKILQKIQINQQIKQNHI